MDCDDIFSLISEGSCSDWEKVANEVPAFPNGCDDFIERRWIINALDSGSKECVKWMLERGVELNFVDEEGFSPIHACLDRRELPDRYEILSLLVKAGADINLRGFNGWTPLHMAAARSDLEGVRLLLRYGADRSIKTIIDDDADPAEEAERLGHHEAAQIIRNFR